MLGSIYHMTLSHFCRKNVIIFCHYVRTVVMDVITFPVNLLSILLHGVISLPDATSYDNLIYNKSASMAKNSGM